MSHNVVNSTMINANTSIITVKTVPVIAESKNVVDSPDWPEITHFKDDAQVKAQEQIKLQEKERERLQLRQARDIGNSGTPRFAIRNSTNFSKNLITAKLHGDTT